jgi:hypothetical protein
VGAGQSMAGPKQSKKTIEIWSIGSNGERYVVDFKRLSIDFADLH